MSVVAHKISGRILDQKQFVIREGTKRIDYQLVEDVMRGDLCCYIIHDFVSNADCDKIVDAFWDSEAKIPRYGEGEGGVEAYLLGASHIEKTTMEYLIEAKKNRQAVADMYSQAESPLQRFKQGLVKNSKNFVEGRAAEYQGQKSLDSKAIYWNNGGEFLLLPHDDLAQLSDPSQAGFEIQEFTRVMAANCYPAVPPDGGQLKVWNIEPNVKSRKKLGLEHSGFPYPADLLDEFENLTISVKKGDLCLLNGNLIHAVMSGTMQTPNKDRLLLTCFMSFNNKNEVIWWT